jgi:hypothetical protein
VPETNDCTFCLQMSPGGGVRRVVARIDPGSRLDAGQLLGGAADPEAKIDVLSFHRIRVALAWCGTEG